MTAYDDLLRAVDAVEAQYTRRVEKERQEWLHNRAEAHAGGNHMSVYEADYDEFFAEANLKPLLAIVQGRAALAASDLGSAPGTPAAPSGPAQSG